MPKTNSRRIQFRELSNNDKGYVVAEVSSHGLVRLFLIAGDHCEVDFSPKNIEEIIDQLDYVLRVAKGRKKKWIVAGDIIPYEWSDREEFEDAQGFLMIEACSGRSRLTIHFDPRSDDWDFVIIMDVESVGQLLKLLREAITPR